MTRSGSLPFILRQAVAIIFLTCTALQAAPVTAAPTEEELKADIVYLCYNQMGEFGAEGVDTCVKAEQRPCMRCPSIRSSTVKSCSAARIGCKPPAGKWSGRAWTRTSPRQRKRTEAPAGGQAC